MAFPAINEAQDAYSRAQSAINEARAAADDAADASTAASNAQSTADDAKDTACCACPGRARRSSSWRSVERGANDAARRARRYASDAWGRGMKRVESRNSALIARLVYAPMTSMSSLHATAPAQNEATRAA